MSIADIKQRLAEPFMILEGVRVQMLLDNPCAPDPRVEREAEALTAAGAEVSILCWDRDGKVAPCESRRSCTVERILIAAGRQVGLRQLINLRRFYVEAWKRLRNREFDVVHAHDLLMLPLGIALARRKAVPLVYDAHEIYHIMEAHRYSKILQYVIAKVEQALVRIGANALITVSQQRVDDYWTRIAAGIPISVVSNWYDPVALTAETRVDARRRFEIPNSAPCITYVGGFTGERRLDLLVGAARARPDVMFLVAGRGMPDVERQLSEASRELPNLRYHGWATDPFAFYAAADAVYYVLDPSHPYSRFAASNTLYMAIAHRLPLITFDIGEPGAVMRRIAPELLLGELSTSALVQVVDTLTYPERRLRIAETLRGWQDRFTWAQARNALLGAYNDAGVESALRATG